MPFRSRFDSTRPVDYGAATAALWPGCVFIGVVVMFVLPNMTGCAILGRRGQSAEVASTARELSRQGVAALEAGQPEQAEELLKKSLAASPDDPTAHRYMGEALWRRGAYGEALSQIAQAIRLEPTNASLAVRAGEMSLASGRREEAGSYAEQAIRLDPKLASAWALRGRCFLQKDRPERALADFERAIDLSPNDSDLLLQIATIYRQRGENERCLTTIYHLLDAYSPGEEPQTVLVMQGQTLMDLGRPQQAADVFLAAVQHGPPSADLFYYLAQSYSAAGRTADATTAAQRALAINASHGPSRQLLAQLASRNPTQPIQRR
ncbi:MAG TPA: tetratricopeptide repeat protein [Lacipirellulaceae bacterium]|nr:tetratricopeptide repeat protein [Lacipirellulaceae bacterium]